MATAAALPKTILITTLPAAASVSPVQKIGIKRPFSIVSTTPLLVNSKSSPSPPSTTITNASWLPATVQRTYKYETLDDGYQDYGDEESSEDHQDGHYGETDQPPRKRERLTHLTAEEKMFRR